MVGSFHIRRHPMLIKITRTYGGQEGHRVKAGRTFWGGNPKEAPSGCDIITHARAVQLLGANLAVRLDEVSTTAAPGAPKRPTAPARRGAVVQEPRTTKVEPRKLEGRATVKKAVPRKAGRGGSTKTPAAKKTGADQTGSPTGKAASPSSSQAGHPTSTSTSGGPKPKRGQRSGGSPSTTPGNSSPGATASTPATADGGSSTESKPGDPPSKEVLE